MVRRARVKGPRGALRPLVTLGFSPSGGNWQRAIPLGSDGCQISETGVAKQHDGEASEAAARYAQAVFELARDANSTDAVEQDFAKFAEAWKASADLRDVARSPLIEPADKARALTAVAAKIGISDLGRKLIGLAAQNRRAAELPAIGSVYRTLVARERGARQVEIVSARPLADSEKSDIIAAVSKSLGSKVEAETRVDDSLIGGFVVRAGSKQFDASVKAKLDALRLALKSA